MLLGFIFVAVGASCFGILPTFQKTLTTGGLSMDSLLFFTDLIMTLVALCMIILQKRSLRVKPLAGIAAFSMGIFGLLLTPILLNYSYFVLPVGTAIMLNFLYPSLVCIVMGTVFHGGFSKLQALAIALSIIGMAFLTGAGGNMDTRGLILAAASAFTYGIYFIANEKGPANDMETEVKFFYASLPGTLFFSAKILASGSLATPTTGGDWVLLIVGSGIMSVGAYFLIMNGIELMGAATASFVSMLEPIVSIVFSTIWFHDPVTLGIIAGGGLVLVSILFITIDGYQKAKQ